METVRWKYIIRPIACYYLLLIGSFVLDNGIKFVLVEFEPLEMFSFSINRLNPIDSKQIIDKRK